MNPLSPKNYSSTHKPMNQFIQKVTSQSHFPQMYSSKYNRFNNRQFNNEVNFTLQNYFQAKNTSFQSRIPPIKYIKSKRPLLADTEEKIYAEVIGLMGEIEEIRENIVSQVESIKQIQIQNPGVEEKVRYHGYNQPLTVQQCSDLEEQNSELIQRIEQLETKKQSTLEESLAAEKAQYQQLKQELAENNVSGEQFKVIQAKIKELKEMIAELQKERSQKLRSNYPGIETLKTENEDLRQRTLAYLKMQELENQEQYELSQYLKKEEQNRLQFMEELQKFKTEYKRIKTENQTLKEKIARRDKTYFKQNSGSKVNGSRLQSHKSSLQVQSIVSKRKDRLSEYQSFIKMMQQNVRG